VKIEPKLNTSFFRKLKEFRFYATTTSEHTLLK